MLQRKTIKRKVAKRKNPTKLELENFIGDKVLVTYKHGTFNGRLKHDDRAGFKEFQISAGRPGFPEGTGFINFDDNDVKRIYNDDGHIEIELK